MNRLHSYQPDTWPGGYWNTYDQGKWEPETFAVLKRFLTPGSSFCDIGAWIGPVTLWAVELGAHVDAWEPDVEARRCLTVNTVGMDVMIHAEAWSDTAGLAPLIPYEYFGDSSSRLAYRPSEDPTQLTEGAVIVQKCTPRQVFNSVYQNITPALVKIDIEGGETLVLPDLTAVCRERQIPIYLSWHEPWWPQPVDETERHSWFDGFELEPIRGDGWTGFSELLAVPE